MKKKKLFLLFGSVSLALMLAAMPFAGGCAPTPEEEVVEPIVLSFVTIVPAVDQAMVSMPEFPKMVEEQSNGELVIDWLGGPEVMDPFGLPEAVQQGVIDMAWVPGAFTAFELVPAAEALGYTNLNTQEQRDSGAYDLMLEYHMDAGLYYFGPLNTSDDVLDAFYILIDKNINNPQDMANQVIGNPFIGMEGLAALGAIPTPVDFMDALDHLEKGIINGYVYVLEGITDFGWHEVAPYLINHGLLSNDSTLIMNLDKWNSLPEHLQDALIGAVLEYEPLGIETARQLRAEEKEKLREAGVEFIEFSPADAEYWKNIFPSAHWDFFIGLNPDIGPELKELYWKE